VAAERLANFASISPGAASRLSDVAVWIAATQNQVPPRQLTNVRLVIFAGDHGVASGDLMAPLSTTTGAMVRAALTEQLGINSLAAAHGVTVRVLDLGVDDDFADLTEGSRAALQAYKVRRSSGAIDVADALSAHEVHAALAAGVAVAHEEIAEGAQLLISGDLGNDDSIPATALIAAALRLPASEVVTAGSGPDDVVRQLKIALVDTALSRLGERASDPIATLAALGGADLAASTGYLLTAARCGVPALLDGPIAVACGLTADRIAAGAAAWFTTGHRPSNPAQVLAQDELGLTPVVDLDQLLVAGAGAVAAVPMLRSAVAMLIQTALPSDLTPD
jgi:nicotinate-nucleotide--dimethylbenzimidazole phosphoribosyltransferase